MTMWFAAPLALIFAVATLTVPPSVKAEKEKSEQTGKGAKEKPEKADESLSAAPKGKRHQRTERQE